MSNIDLIDSINRFENGDLSDEETIELFQSLLDTGTINVLQGSYQRYLNDFIEAGLVSEKFIIDCSRKEEK